MSIYQNINKVYSLLINYSKLSAMWPLSHLHHWFLGSSIQNVHTKPLRWFSKGNVAVVGQPGASQCSTHVGSPSTRFFSWMEVKNLQADLWNTYRASESSINSRPPNLLGQFMRPWGLQGFDFSVVSIGKKLPSQLLLQSRDLCETGGSFLERCWCVAS